jgi:4-hydroxythreonine-4-phosphate dehydrogenase
VLAEHARRLGSTLRFVSVRELDDAVVQGDVVPVLSPPGESLPQIRWGEVDPAAGALVGRCLEQAFELGQDGALDGVVWAPINKQAFHLAGYAHRDELDFLAELTGAHHTRLYGVLGALWTTCVTLHVPLREVAALVTRDGVLDAIQDIHDVLAAAEIDDPSIAVAALNPHAGDGGLLGREEIDSIGPAVADARDRGIRADGPFAGDTLFPRALDQGFHGVVCMYHDQANIARKLHGSGDGATVITGLPIPSATTAHGTAFDRAGQGTADPGSLRAALRHVAALSRARAGSDRVTPEQQVRSR